MKFVKRRKEKAFDELYRRYSTKLYNYFYRMLYQDKELASDFLQELFMKIIERPAAFDTKRRFSTWIYTVAANMCKNEYRRKSRQPEMKILEDDSHSDELKVPQQLDKILFDKALVKAMDGLEVGHKMCFVLRYQNEMNIKSISEIVGCPEGTVKSRLYYTTKYLAKELKIFHPKYERKYE